MGQNPGSLVGFNPTAGSSELAVTSQEQKLAAENLYRDANTLIYGDSNPSEDAIDRVVSKINQEYVFNRFPRLSTLTFRSVLTRKVNSLGSASTRRKEILPTSTSTIASSTRRQVFFPLTRFAHSYPSVISDCEILRQVYGRDTCQFRARYRSIKRSSPCCPSLCFSAARILVSFLVAVFRTISTSRWIHHDSFVLLILWFAL
jgi:SYF2 splicing factor